MRRSVKFALLFSIAGSVLLTTGCDNAKRGEISKSGDAKTPWRKTETPPGADPNVPAEQGGAGFEELAESQGFILSLIHI